MAEPSCPLCGQRDRVDRDPAPNGRWVWLCSGCWTVFNGGQDEWNRMGEQRSKRQRTYAELQKKAKGDR